MKHYTLTTEDIGAKFLAAFGKLWPVSGFLGRILEGDVGKRVYLRGGILQAENDEQHAARMKCYPPGAKMESAASLRGVRKVWSIPNRDAFEINVAWLRFMAEWKPGVSGPTLADPTTQSILRLMRIAFDWAMAYPQEQAVPTAKTDRLCQAPHSHNPDDFETISKRLAPATRCECPTGCGMLAVMHLFLVTMYVHETPMYEDVATVFCEPCGDDALESGQFCAGDDLLEPHGQSCDSRCRAYPMKPCPIHEGGQS